MPELREKYIYDSEIIDVKEASVFASGGELGNDTIEKRLMRKIVDNQIRIKDLEEILGREPNYPNDYVGNIKLQKSFLRPYYKLA